MILTNPFLYQFWRHLPFCNETDSYFFSAVKMFIEFIEKYSMAIIPLESLVKVAVKK
jgi:hypothetical protein